MNENEYKELSKSAKKSGQSVGAFVRDAIRERTVGERAKDPAKLLNIISKYFKLSAPVSDIDTMNEEIMRSRINGDEA